jgi:hypothetical protein
VLLVPTPQRFRIFGSEEESSDSGHFFRFRSSSGSTAKSSPGSVAAQLRAAAIAVEIDPQSYPNGRFASLHDPEGNLTTPVAVE